MIATAAIVDCRQRRSTPQRRRSRTWRSADRVHDDAARRPTGKLRSPPAHQWPWPGRRQGVQRTIGLSDGRDGRGRLPRPCRVPGHRRSPSVGWGSRRQPWAPLIAAARQSAA